MHIPFFQEISRARSVLIAGAGGGFDVVSGIPLYLHLQNIGVKAVLANLSFTALAFSEGEEVCNGTYRVDGRCKNLPYFPEKYIFDWLTARGDSPAIYAFSNQLGVAPLTRAYNFLIEHHGIDTLLLVDGGTDSLMFGDEAKVGTIVEDACSIIAAAEVPVANRYLAAIGFGVEHELNHHACLENISALIRDKHYLGALSLTGEMAEGEAFLDLVASLNEKMRLHQSIVTNSISSAMQGKFGDHHSTRRTQGTEQFINPLMSLFWFFRLQGVAEHIRFASTIRSTETMDEVAKAFQMYRAMHKRRLHRAIPLK
ncbi:MAG: hypothetical protein RIR70_857 [Pseudomonadota bacterium]|jgi:hypothetical protein